jgi:ribosomal protein S27AE
MKVCSKCGAKAQAHHDDYKKPLDVRWLCPKHHGEHHRNVRDER